MLRLFHCGLCVKHQVIVYTEAPWGQIHTCLALKRLVFGGQQCSKRNSAPKDAHSPGFSGKKEGWSVMGLPTVPSGLLPKAAEINLGMPIGGYRVRRLRFSVCDEVRQEIWPHSHVGGTRGCCFFTLEDRGTRGTCLWSRELGYLSIGF